MDLSSQRQLPAVLESDLGASCSNYPNQRRWHMGDKDPKSKAREAKQAATEKDQKKADAFTKAHPTPGVLPRKPGK